MILRERISKIRRGLKTFFEDAQTVNNDKATGIIEYEIKELENIFSLLLFGSFIGLPSPPAHITLQLLPLMEKELINMFEKVQTAYDPLGEMTELFGEV